MSLTSMFSSPSKQASQTASAVQGIDQNDITQAENYVTGQEQQERGAIAGLGTNPYFAAAQQIQPTSLTETPTNTTTFGSSGTGTTLAPANTFSGTGTATSAPVTGGATNNPQRRMVA